LQRNGIVKFLQFNDLLFVIFVGKKQPKQVGKCHKFEIIVMATTHQSVLGDGYMNVVVPVY